MCRIANGFRMTFLLGHPMVTPNLTLFPHRGFASDGARRVGPVHARKRPENGSRAAKAGCGRLTGMDALLSSRSDGPLDVRPEWWCSRRAALQLCARRHAGHQKCSVSLSARARSVRIHPYSVSAGSEAI